MARAPNPNLQPALVEAAVAVFAEHGLAAAKVSDITERAGVSKGAFYLHFESKEALYEQICRNFLATIVNRLHSHELVMCDLSLTPAEMFEELGQADEALLDLFWDHRQPLKMILQGAIGTASAWLADEFIDSIEAVMLQTVSRHHEESGVPSPFRPEFMAAMATGITVMYARRVVHQVDKPVLGQDIRHFRRLMTIGALLPTAQLDVLLEQAFAGVAAHQGAAHQVAAHQVAAHQVAAQAAAILSTIEH
jgi:AcrR family transcriptional regulator